MGYIKTLWKDRSVERPLTFNQETNPDGSVTFLPAEGVILEPGTPFSADNLNKVEQGIADVDAAVAAHKADYSLQIPWGGTTTNSGNAYLLALPNISALSAGMAVCFKCNADATGIVTLNWNNKGAKNVLKANGIAVSNWKNGGLYTVRYDGVNFYQLGEGGDLSKLNNLIINGSFENDLNGWEIYSGSPAIDAGTSLYGSKSVKCVDGNALKYVFGTPLVSGHKYYFTANVNVTVFTKGLASISIVENNIWNSIYQGAITSGWVRKSGIHTAAGGIGYLYIGNASVPNMTSYYDGVMIFDLTDAFGAGNEPLLAEIDAMVANFSGWWDSDIQSLTNDATATTADIVLGKIAYVNGLKLTGTNTNKRWASGTTTSVKSGSTEQLTISGLGFTPSIFITETTANIKTIVWKGYRQYPMYVSAIGAWDTNSASEALSAAFTITIASDSSGGSKITAGARNWIAIE